MQSASTSVPSAGDFASLLASLAAPPKPEPQSDDDGLADDVSTISYEHALRAHAPSRFRAGGADAAQAPPPIEASETGAAPKSLKTASITIRLSEPECVQLRQRAAEAGLTVSAYLRSCTLDVESLRAQVKETLAEMCNSKPAVPPQETTAERAGWFASILLRLRSWAGQLRRRRRPPFTLNPANPFAPVRYSS